MAGHNETLVRFYTFFGGGEPKKPESKKPEMNPALFDRLFGGKKK